MFQSAKRSALHHGRKLLLYPSGNNKSMVCRPALRLMRFAHSTKERSDDPGLAWTSVISHPRPVPGPEGIPSRSDQLSRLQDPNAEYDVLVIGGGATGAGIALDAAVRGLKVACIERGDFASETSSRSTKLIWAGIK